MQKNLLATLLTIAVLALIQILAMPVFGGESSEQSLVYYDAHVHFHPCASNDLDNVMEWMKKNNIERVINHTLKQMRPKNDAERTQMVKNYEKYKGRILWFTVIYPDEVNSVEEAVALLKKDIAAGAVGFGEHYGETSGGEKLAFDDPRNMRLFEACEKVGLPLMFHMDRSRNVDNENFDALQKALKAYPNLKIIAHADWWRGARTGACGSLLKTYPNLYADMSCVSKRLNDPALAKSFFTEHADKIMYGSDAGWWTLGKAMPKEYQWIADLKLPKEVEDKILRGTFDKLFPNP